MERFLKTVRLKKPIKARVGATVRFRYGRKVLFGKVIQRLGDKEHVQLVIEVPGESVWYSVPRSACF